MIKKDDIIRTREDLEKILGNIPIYEIPKLPDVSQAERRKIQLDAIKRSRNNKGKDK